MMTSEEKQQTSSEPAMKRQKGSLAALPEWKPDAKLKGDYQYEPQTPAFRTNGEKCRLSFPVDNHEEKTEGSPYSIAMTRRGGRYKPNQDFGVLMELKDFVLAAAFDGNGEHGQTCAERAVRDLPFDLINQPQLQAEPERVFHESFLRADKNQTDLDSGTTAVLAVRMGKRFYFASAGDSFGLLVRFNGKDRSTEVVAEAVKHSPRVPSERIRIQAAGGRVEASHNRVRVVFKTPNGEEVNVAMSRMMGDPDGKASGVLIAEPSVVEVEDLTQLVANDDSFLFVVVATDGIMDMIPTSQIISELGKALEHPDRAVLTETCQELMSEASSRWAVTDLSRDPDDMMLVVTRLYL